MIDWNNVKLPKGVTRDEFVDDIFEICHIKSYQWTNASDAHFMSREDLKQEMMLKCFRSIKNFNPEKSYDAEAGKWKLYFYRACDSVTRDVDKKYTFNRGLPCKKCPLFDKAVGCTKYEQKIDCSEYSSWESLNKRKFMLGTLYGTGGSSPSVPEGTYQDGVYAESRWADGDNLLNDPIQASYKREREYDDYSSNILDLFDYVNNKCTEEIKAIFKDLCESNYDPKQVGKKNMDKLRKALKGKFDWS